MISYEEFLPYYPDINENFFQQKILNKKEFYDLKLDSEIETISKGDFLNHQKMIQRFLSDKTIYDELLLYHGVGTGKTGVAFSVTENLIDSGSFSKIFVLTKNPELLDALMGQLVDRFSKRYVLTQKDRADNSKKLRKMRKMTSDFYTFRTFQTFTNELSSTPDDILRSKYNNTIFIMDEVHNIKPDEDAKIYKQFWRLFHSVRNRKILLMTGTPMRNDVYDIAYIMNLILPEDKQLPVGKSFNDKYIVGDNIYNEPSLKSYFKGRISILLSSDKTGVNVIYMGNFFTPPNIEKFKMYSTMMSEFQTKHYLEAYTKDTGVENSIYSNSRQAALFVFPDGSYGQEGFDKYIEKNGQLKNELKIEIDNVEKLKKYSCKYASIIENILDPRNNNKKIYIYCSIVNGSGINLLTKILRIYGFTHARGNEKNTGNRFISLTSETPNIGNLLKYYNSKENMRGDYCRIVIGSRKISEGFTFKDVQIIHIATMHWNETEIQQAKARAIRYKAYDNLQRRGIVPQVRIFQHASLPLKNVSKSIDVQMMNISKNKDILIRKMDRVIKEISFDCPLVYERNYRNYQPGSSECDYQQCEYKCDDSYFEPTEVDLSTYQLYYFSDGDIINGIRNLFSNYFSLRLETIQDLLSVDYFQLVKTLYTLIYNNVPIVNKYGVRCYLREHDNIYYIVDNIILANNHSEMNIYTEQPFYTKSKTLSEVIQERGYIHNLQNIRNISESKSEEDVKKYLLNLPLNIQEIFLETALEIKYIQRRETNIINWIENIYREFITISENPRDNYILKVTLLETNIRCLSKNERIFTNCIDTTITSEQNLEQVETLENLETNPYGFYGIIEEDRFCIKDVRDADLPTDKRKMKTGANCLQVQFNKDKLAEVCIHLGIPIPEGSRPNSNNIRNELLRTKAGKKLLERWNDWTDEQLSLGYYWISLSKIEICGIIKDWFAQHGLLIQGKCGKAGKLKE